METATQALHRLTSYEPRREWDEPIDDPRVLQDLETNDLERLPWFYLPIGAITVLVLGQIAVFGPAARAAKVSPAVATRSA